VRKPHHRRGRVVAGVRPRADSPYLLAVPFKGRHAVKLGFATGVYTEFGTNFDQYLVSYQVLIR